MYDIIIIGAGPGGVSSALYSKRANMNVLLLYNDGGELKKAHKIDNYYGFPNGIEGIDLFNNGLKQAENLGVDISKEEVLDIRFTGNSYELTTKNNKYNSLSVIIATGIKRDTPNIKGLKDFEGKGVSYCAICDGFFYKNKRVAVLGNQNYALSEANELKNVTKEVLILTNGNKMEVDSPYEVIADKISELTGNEKLESIKFDNGKSLDIDGLFVAIGTAGGLDFAKKLGILTEKNHIIVNENMETNINGIYAVGNLTGGLLQVNKAVYDGAIAGINASNYVRKVKENRNENNNG